MTQFVSVGSKVHYFPEYRKGRGKYALWLVDGEWVTSSKTNEELAEINARVEKHNNRADIKNAKFIDRLSIKNVTNAISYVYALQIRDLIESKQFTFRKVSELYNVDKTSIYLIIYLLKSFGAKGFYKYE